jgi:hypothetical protein
VKSIGTRSPSYAQSAPCPRCRSRLAFTTDGHGKLVTECPHCDRGEPLRPLLVPKVGCPICGRVTGAVGTCERCLAQAERIRRGIKNAREAMGEAEYFRKRQAAAKKSWQTRRAQDGREAPSVRARPTADKRRCAHCQHPITDPARMKTCSPACAQARQQAARPQRYA